MGTSLSILLVCFFFLGFVPGLPTMLKTLIAITLGLYFLAGTLRVTRFFISRQRSKPIFYLEEGLAESAFDTKNYRLPDGALFSCFASELVSEVNDKTHVKAWFDSVYPILSEEEVSRVEELFDDWQHKLSGT